MIKYKKYYISPRFAKYIANFPRHTIDTINQLTVDEFNPGFLNLEIANELELAKCDAKKQKILHEEPINDANTTLAAEIEITKDLIANIENTIKKISEEIFRFENVETEVKVNAKINKEYE